MCSVGRTLWQEDFFFNVALRPQRPYRLTRTSTSTFTKPLSSADLWVQVLCCFTSTETTKTVRDVEPWTATSTFTMPLSSADLWVQVLCCFTSTETTKTVRDVEPWTATSTFTQLLSSLTALFCFFCSVALCPQRPHGLLGTSTRTSTSTLTQLLSSDDQRTRTGLFLFFSFSFYNNAAAGHWSVGTSGCTMKGLPSSLANLDKKTLAFILRLHILETFFVVVVAGGGGGVWSARISPVLLLFVCLFWFSATAPPHPPPHPHTHTQNHTHNNNNKKDCLTVSVIGRRSTVAGWTVRCEPGF